MDFALRVVVFLLGLLVGTMMLKYHFSLTRLFGLNSLAERYIGTGGTYTMWKLLGVATIIISAIYAFR